jgi:glycosyltransferase involved in cell wall biosynthesis
MRKNILILCHNYGVQFLESCNQYSQLFDTARYEVTVIYLIGPANDQIRSKTLAEQVVFLNLPKYAISGLKLHAIRKLLKICREKSFDTVICHRYKPTYIMLWVAQFCQIKNLFFVMHALSTVKALPRKLLLAALYKKNMYFAGVSNAVCDDLRKDVWRIPQQKIITFYNIIDYELFEPKILSREQARRELGIPQDSIVFGNIGRLVKAKDQRTLLDALALLKTSSPTAHVTIIGDGRLEKELKTHAQHLQISHRVIFTGFVEDGFRFMKAFNALVLCSVEEAFGRVLLEAMIARIPIIATRADGIPEVVGNTGYLVEPSNATQLASAMQKIYSASNSELTALGEKSYQRMLDNFSPASFKKTFMQLVGGDYS